MLPPMSHGGTGSSLKLRFLGAAGTVTGSRFLVSSPAARVLVDCGLFQGVKQLRMRNWAPLPLDAARLDGVVLSHAHIDHSGYLPALVRAGYTGPIHATEPTRDLCAVLLPDSGKLQEEDARYAGARKFSRHAPPLPLYTQEDAERVLPQIRPVAFDEVFRIGDLELCLRPAGHILGAACVRIRHAGRELLFSGDLGRPDDLLMRPPAPPGEPDWVVVESTYGDRQHPDLDPIARIAEILTETLHRGGALLIPSFAVGRAQSLLYCLNEAFRSGLAPRVPVFVNSPMATDVTGLYVRHAEHHRLSPEQCAEICGIATFTRSVEASKELAARRGPMVIISASGMATGGRILHHLKALAPDHRNTILLPGFQAPGTRGDALASGAEQIKIHGAYVRVRARVEKLDVLSAHADQADLLDWLGRCGRPPRRVFVVHGEPVAADTLRRLVRERLGSEAHVAEYLETVALR